MSRTTLLIFLAKTYTWIKTAFLILLIGINIFIKRNMNKKHRLNFFTSFLRIQ